MHQLHVASFDITNRQIRCDMAGKGFSIPQLQCSCLMMQQVVQNPSKVKTPIPNHRRRAAALRWWSHMQWAQWSRACCS
jgi:hypothetical protein